MRDCIADLDGNLTIGDVHEFERRFGICNATNPTEEKRNIVRQRLSNTDKKYQEALRRYQSYKQAYAIIPEDAVRSLRLRGFELIDLLALTYSINGYDIDGTYRKHSIRVKSQIEKLAPLHTPNH